MFSFDHFSNDASTFNVPSIFWSQVISLRFLQGQFQSDGPFRTMEGPCGLCLPTLTSLVMLCNLFSEEEMAEEQN